MIAYALTPEQRMRFGEAAKATIDHGAFPEQFGKTRAFLALAIESHDALHDAMDAALAAITSAPVQTPQLQRAADTLRAAIRGAHCVETCVGDALNAA